MFYFVHPQIKFNFGNLKKIFSSFLKFPDFGPEASLEKLSLINPGKQYVFTDMGRSAFKIIIEKLNLQNSQIIFPAYICDIFYPIFKQYNIQPVFVDIDQDTFQMKIEDIEKKITPKTKAIFVCHTYGLPAETERIKSIAGNSVAIIEDKAHALANLKSDNVAFFSLYKSLPTLRGGMLLCSKDWKINLVKTSFNFRDLISFFNCFPFFAYLFKTFGNQVAPRMLRKEKKRKLGNLNNFSVNLFKNFLKDFQKNLAHRVEIALFFQEELENLGFEVQESKNNVFCYLSALAPKNVNRDKLVKELWKQNIFCTRIWHTPIVLNEEAIKDYGLNLNDFPNTVNAAERIVNFPLQNYFEKKDVERIIEKLKLILEKQAIACT